MAAIVLTTGLFFLWGVANNLNDVLIAHFRHIFSLSDFGSGVVQSAFYLGCFCFALPAAIVAERFGYKATVILGLLLFGGGALLFALIVIASGLAILETAANPMVAAMGDPAGAAQRLNLAQAFNPLGSITGVALGATLILSDAPLQGPAAAAAAISCIEKLVTLFGSDRLIWGSDWPVMTLAGRYADWLDLCRKAIPAALHGQIFAGNAARIYRLEGRA